MIFAYIATKLHVMKNTLLTLLLIVAASFSLNAQDSKPNVNPPDSQPVFANGKMSMAQFFKIYLKYPESAIEAGTEGIVMISFDVEADGEVANPVIVKGAAQSLNEEALRVVSLFPYYKPATKDGENIKMSLTVPVKFQLQTNSTISSSTDGSKPVQKLPLYVIDGKIINDDINVNANEIESIRVIKGQKAIEKYGERALDGAIVITTKQTTPRR